MSKQWQKRTMQWISTAGIHRYEAPFTGDNATSALTASYKKMFPIFQLLPPWGDIQCRLFELK